MATVGELKDALRDTLEHRGVLGGIKARMRSEIYAALNDEKVAKPELSRENFLINELVREYLQYNQYKHTESTLLAETGQAGQPINREYLAAELRVADSPASQQVPLLYGILAMLQEGAEDGEAAGEAAPRS